MILISHVKTWKKINQLTDEMFSNQYGGLGRRKIHFYGNDGVCLFKYFVTGDDPQKAYVWGCLSWNLLCFLIIFACYTKVLLFSKNSKRQLARRRGRDHDESEEDRRKTQKYVSAVILTDFVCWIPFTVVCVLHSLEVIDASPLYTVSSIVILPINALINPILYNNFLTSTFKRIFMRGRYWLTRIHTFYVDEILSKNNQVSAGRGKNTRQEIELGAMPRQGQSPSIFHPNSLANVRETEF